MSDTTYAELLLLGGAAGYAAGLAAIMFALSKTRLRWWWRYIAYAGYTVVVGNLCNYLVDPSRYSSAHVVDSLTGCSTAMALTVAATWIVIARARGQITSALSATDRRDL